MNTRLPPVKNLALTLGVVFAGLGQSSAIAGPYEATILSDNPFAYYRFEESAGPTAVNSGSGGSAFNGTLSGGYTLGQASYGNLGSAIRFNGTNSFVTAPQSVGSGSFTVEAWINTTVNSLSGSFAYEGNGTIWSDVGGGANDWTVSILNNRLSVFTGDTNTGLTAGPLLNDGNWHYIAAVRDSGNATSLYVNGALVGSYAAGSAALTANPQIKIGANTLDNRYFNGMMDEVAIYQGALTGAQILQHYQSASAPANVDESSFTFGLLLAGAAALFGIRRKLRAR